MEWEYLVVRIDTAGLYRSEEPDEDGDYPWLNINKLGAACWELVTVAWADGDEGTAIFKRQVN